MGTMQFTPEQLLNRFEERREIQNLMSRYTYCYTIKREKDIFNLFWSRRADICLGVNQGWYLGSEAVSGYYQAIHRKNLLKTGIIEKLFPKETANLSEQERYGVGSMEYKPLDTAVIEIAGDMQTAKGLWCCRGSYLDLTTGGPVSYWEWSFFAVDFVRESDGWKIWHMRYLMEIDSPCGKSWAAPFEGYPPEPGFEAMADFRMPEPTQQEVLRELYSPLRAFRPAPRTPEPYDTFANTFTYGAEGGGNE